jgi:hypothetical protein
MLSRIWLLQVSHENDYYFVNVAGIVTAMIMIFDALLILRNLSLVEIRQMINNDSGSLKVVAFPQT